MSELPPSERSLAKPRSTAPRDLSVARVLDDHLPIAKAVPAAIKISEVAEVLGANDLSLRARWKFGATILKVQESLIKAQGGAITIVAEKVADGYVKLQDEKLRDFLREARQFYASQGIGRSNRNRDNLVSELTSQIGLCYDELTALEALPSGSKTQAIRIQHTAEILNRRIEQLHKEVESVFVKWESEFGAEKILTDVPIPKDKGR